MLPHAAVFFAIALVAALFGFTGIVSGAASIGRLLFVLFTVLAVTSLLIGLSRGV